jgi:ABC-type Fe3+-hydroxamate transport system substrate-binding protein
MALTVYDALSRQLTFMAPPTRVVSLVPSDTFNVASVFAGSALVGRTDYCELPGPLVGNIPSVGGTKNPRVKDILDLSPDLVIANKEENTKGDLEELIRHNVRVYISFPTTVKDGIAHIAKLARIFRTERDCKDLIASGYALLKEPAPTGGIRAFCPIWMNPLMTIHADTYISDSMTYIGCENVFADRERKYPLAADLGKRESVSLNDGRDTRYPRITEQELLLRAPELALLPDEPHPFSKEDADTFAKLGVFKRILHVDGKDLTWYGVRAIEGIPRLRKIVNDARS